MPNINQMMTALRNADAAGDTQAATRIAAMIKAEKQKDQAAAKAQAMKDLAAKQSFGQSLLISAGKGLYDIGRGLGFVDEADEIEKMAYQALEKESPVSTTIGEAVGQSAPFLFPATAAGAIASTPLRVGAMGLIGAGEGAAIASSQGKNYDDILKTGGVTGAVAGASEILFPHIGRVASRLYRRVKGVDAPTGLFTKEGVPTPELQGVMADSGLSMDDIIGAAKREAGADVGETVTQAQFKKFNTEPTLGELTQDINIQKPEQFLMEQTTDESGNVLRAFKRSQSENIKKSIDDRVDSLGLPDDAGQSIKDALSGRKAKLKADRKKAYQALSESTKNLTEGMPLVSDSLMANLPDAGTIRDVAASVPNNYKALTGLMTEFGIEQSDEAVEALTKQGVDITPLNIDNFESFRKRLGAIERADQTGTIGLLTNPIRKALDDEVDLATKQLIKSGNPDIAGAAKTARQSHIALKKEFDDKAMTEILIKPKARGSNMPNVEDSQVYAKIAARSTPIEQVARVVDSISGNKKALGNLQAQTLTDLIDSAFQASSRKIDGVRQFGGAAFQKRFQQLQPKLDVIFKNNPQMLNDIKALNQVAAKLTPPSGAVPKGSAGFFVDAMDSLGLFKILNKIPIAGDATAVALRKVSALSSNKKTLDKAVNASPQVKEYVKMINRDLPSVAVLLGISGYADEEENE